MLLYPGLGLVVELSSHGLHDDVLVVIAMVVRHVVDGDRVVGQHISPGTFDSILVKTYISCHHDQVLRFCLCLGFRLLQINVTYVLLCNIGSLTPCKYTRTSLSTVTKLILPGLLYTGPVALSRVVT